MTLNMSLQELADLIGESTNANSTASMNASQLQSDPEKNSFILKSFISLLSSARSTRLADPINPSPEPNLARFLSSRDNYDFANGSGVNDQASCSIPSLFLKRTLKDAAGISGNLTPRDSAAFMLALPLFVDKSNVETVPIKIINNISQSLLNLIESRLRSSNAALLKQAFQRHPSLSAETSILTHLLQNSPITLNTVVTSFRVVSTNRNPSRNRYNTEILLPLVFETVMDVSILGQLTTISFQAPGTVTGSFNCHDGLLQHVDIEFDTIALLQTMMKQARSCVRKTIARGVSISRILAEDPLLKDSKSSLTPVKVSSNASIATLSSQWKSNSLVHQRSSSALPSTTKSSDNNLKRKEAPATKEEEPYQLFAWLAGDKMMLKEDPPIQQEPRKQEKSIANEHLSNSNLFGSLLLSKRRRVSFQSL